MGMTSIAVCMQEYFSFLFFIFLRTLFDGWWEFNLIGGDVDVDEGIRNVPVDQMRSDVGMVTHVISIFVFVNFFLF